MSVLLTFDKTLTVNITSRVIDEPQPNHVVIQWKTEHVASQSQISIEFIYLYIQW